MEAIIRPNADSAARLVEQIITGELRRNPSMVLGLATGHTMEAVYHLLVKSTSISPSAARLTWTNTSASRPRTRIPIVTT
jgi:6-phosphogluconolactonase/glucosamine-6-phosphate isomerase/deaminase